MIPLRTAQLTMALLAFAVTTDASTSNRGTAGQSQQRERRGAAMRVELILPTSVHAGDTVAITLRATNAGSAPVDLVLPGRPTAFDIVVTNRAGAQVWRRLRGADVAAALGVRTLQPGDTLELTDRWTQVDNVGGPVAPGTYYVHGYLPAEGQPLTTATHELRITR